MRKLLVLLPVALLVACSSTPKPDTGAFAGKDCAALEEERVRLVTELNAMSAAEIDRIETTRTQLDAVAEAQMAQGCAG